CCTTAGVGRSGSVVLSEAKDLLGFQEILRSLRSLRMTNVAFLSHSDCGRHDTGWGHPEHVGRLRAIPRALREDPELFGVLLHAEGRHATEDELILAHDAGYVASVREIAAAGGGHLDADTVASEGSWDAARAGVGCLLD